MATDSSLSICASACSVRFRGQVCATCRGPTTVRHRLASLLVRLASGGQRTPRGVEVELPASQQEIAAQIGTVRELVSRGLGRLQAQGIIELEGRKIKIRDVKALEKEMEDSQ